MAVFTGMLALSLSLRSRISYHTAHKWQDVDLEAHMLYTIHCLEQSVM